VVLAVGDEHDRLVLTLPSLQSRQALVDRGRQRRAATRDQVDVDRIEALREDAEVQGERTLHERGPRECDESDAVAAQLVQEVPQGELRAGEPVRLDVHGQHAARRVECDDEVDAFPTHLLPAKAPLRAGQGDDEGRHRCREQALSEPPATWLGLRHHDRLQGVLDETVEIPAATAVGPGEKGDDGGHEDQRREQQPFPPCDHGNVLSRVAASPISTRSNPSAGQASHGYSSR
jgi:hypothetical protein